MRGQLLHISDLDQDERHVLSDAFFTNVHINVAQDPYVTYAKTLSDWGIMCDHPDARRDGQHCGCCGSSVVLEVPLKHRKRVGAASR